MNCDDVGRVLSLDLLPEEVGGEDALRVHGRDCARCAAAVGRFLDDETLLRERFAIAAADASMRAAAGRRASRRRVRILVTAAVLAASLLVWWVMLAPAQAHVLAVHGDAVVNGRSLQVGLLLRDGSRVTTGVGGEVEIELADQSRLAIGANSDVKIGPGRGLGISVALASGDLHCDVSHAGGAFRVASPCGEVVAMGTEFRLRYSGIPEPAAAGPSQTKETIMTNAGGTPVAALLTVTVLSGWVELRAAGSTTAVHAEERLVAPLGGVPNVTKLTSAKAPVAVPALGGAGMVRQVQPMVSALALSPDGKEIAICVRQLSGGDLTENGPDFVGVNLWNVAAGRFEGFIRLDGSPSDVMFDADGQLWVTEAMNNEMRRLDRASQKVAQSIDLNRPPNLLTSDSTRLYPSPDGKRVVIAGFNTSKTVYSYPDWKVESVLEGPTDSLPVECAWSADGKSFVGATHDDKLLQWSLSGPNGSAATGTSARLQGQKSAGEGFGPVFGPDGKVWALTSDMLAFGPVDGSGDQRRRFASEGPTWNMARFSPDGKRLAIGVVDGSVRVLDVARGETVETIPYEAPPDVTPWIGCLLWAPDGTWLAAGRLDGSSFLLRLDKQ